MSNKNKTDSNIRITSTGREYLDLSGEAGIELAQEILESGIFDKASDNKQNPSPRKNK
jgi:hypothetical protein